MGLVNAIALWMRLWLMNCRSSVRFRRPTGIPSFYWFIIGYLGSFEQSPGMFEAYGSWPESGTCLGHGSDRQTEDQVRESLADAMIESPVCVESGPMCRNASSGK